MPPWPLPRVDEGRDQWEVDGQEFPKLRPEQAASKCIGSADPGDTGRGKSRDRHTNRIPRVVDRGMRPAKCSQTVGKGNHDVRTRDVPGALTVSLSPWADIFTPGRTPDNSQKQQQNTDMDLHRSLAMTGVSETEPPWNNINDKNATMVLADSIETEQPVAVADVAEPGGPAGTGTGGPVETERGMTPATDRTGASGSRSSMTDAPVTLEFECRSENNEMTASGLAETGTGGPVGNRKGRSRTDEIAEVGMRTGTGTGGPVLAGTGFTTIAEVYAPISGRQSQQGSEVGGLDPTENITTERTDSDELSE